MVKVLVIRLGGDDPKKSTALKLVRLGLAELLPSFRSVPRGAVVLDPFSPTVLTPADREHIASSSLVVIDGSWNTDIDQIRKLSRTLRGVHRVLPVLKAGNPINYGILTKLSSAEAVAAALYITGFVEEALKVLSKFKWGHTFLELNSGLLDRYRSASSIDEVRRIQEDVLKHHGLL